MRYAIIVNGKVDNVIIADQDFVDAHYSGAILLNDEDVVGPNYIYENGQFIEPIIKPVEKPTNV